MTCNEIIISNDYIDLLVAVDEVEQIPKEPECIQKISNQYEIWYYDRAKVTPLTLDNYTYSAIPMCFGLLDSSALEASGILKVQYQPTLSLKGQGVFVGIIDTGIAYESPAFIDKNGNSRIYSIWDQTGTANENNKTPKLFAYGVEYTKERINQALQSEKPSEIVPEKDEIGHGTYLAGVACGSADLAADYTGAAPEADLIVVKLKPAKKYLKEFYFIPDSTPVYQENDIMAAIAYMEEIAEKENKPLVICIALGTNNGSHSGTSILCDYMNQVAALRKRAMVIAMGNEANARHHYRGIAGNLNVPVTVEVNVEKDTPGFYLEMWANAPEIFAVALIAPTGEVVPKVMPRSGGHQEFSFIFENTDIIVDYRIVGRTRGDQLIFIQFVNAAKGIWQVKIYPENTVTGVFNMYLPMNGMLESDVYFLESTPETTLTTPAATRLAISVGGYNDKNGALYLDSGRGYTADNGIKPDFCAPCVEVQGVGLRKNYVYKTGSSVASAICAGACAQFLEWAVVKGHEPSVNTVEIKNILIRGCRRNSQLTYPNSSWGYGQLDLYNAFANL